MCDCDREYVTRDMAAVTRVLASVTRDLASVTRDRGYVTNDILSVTPNMIHVTHNIHSVTPNMPFVVFPEMCFLTHRAKSETENSWGPRDNSQDDHVIKTVLQD